METGQLIDALAIHGDEPGHPVSSADKLRLFSALMMRINTLGIELAAEISSPTEAALFAHTVERGHRQGEVTQIRAAHSAQRTLVQELPARTLDQVRAIAAAPMAFIDGQQPLPADPATVPTGIMPFKDAVGFLQHDLHIPHAAAANRLHAANALLATTDVHGNPDGPRYPRLAEQLDTGSASLGPTAAAARKLDKLASTIARQPDPSGLAEHLEGKIADSVAAGIPTATNRLFNAISDELDEATAAGQMPSPEEIRARAGIFITKRTKHFTYFSACMLNADAEVFLSHFARSDNPRTQAGDREALAASATGMGPGTNDAQDTGTGNASSTPTGSGEKIPERPRSGGSSTDRPDWFTHPGNAETFETAAPGAPPGIPADLAESLNTLATGPDGLTPPQRHLQTLLNLMRSSTGSHPKGATGLPTAQLVILCRLETLLGLAKGNGWSAHGLEIPVEEVRRRLATDGTIPAVLGGQGEILDVGQEMRFANDVIRRAVLARDGGCFYPGCTVPPEHLEMCHIEPFAEGGRTSVKWMTPGCITHHHMADNGLLTLLIHNGIPHVVLPKHLDPEQLPRRNTYWPQNQARLF